jgi:hypothetical protein
VVRLPGAWPGIVGGTHGPRCLGARHARLFAAACHHLARVWAGNIVAILQVLKFSGFAVSEE